MESYTVAYGDESVCASAEAPAYTPHCRLCAARGASLAGLESLLLKGAKMLNWRNLGKFFK